MRFFKLLFIVLIFISCGTKEQKKIKDVPTITEKKTASNLDSLYTLDDNYPIKDARRYGLTAELARVSHPKTGKNRLTSVLDLAEKVDFEISFPSGYYKMNLTLDSRKNMKLRFNKSEFSLIHITQVNKQDNIPENIEIKGTLISYDGLGITMAKKINIDSVILKSNNVKSLFGETNRGCHIYYGCDDIKINYLEVQDLGSKSKKHTNTHAAVAIDGYGYNPKNVTINKVHIKSSDRHGVYMTGTDNTIKELIVDKFGFGSSEFMSGMQDADNTRGENKEFTGLWLNKCNYCFVDKVTINEANSKATNTVFLDSGDPLKESEIGELIILNDNPNIGIKKEPNTNVQLIQTTIK